MSRQARIRAAAASAVALAIGIAFATGAIQGAWANFQAETQNSNVQVGGGWINAPTSLSASPSGYAANFTWVHGNTGVSPFGSLTSQQLYFVNQGTTNSCSSVTYASIGSALSGTANSTSDAQSSADNGDYYCYMLRSFMNTWSVDTNFAPSPIQMGLVPTSISYSGSGAHQITNGTTFTVNFNQTITFSTANTRLCIFSGTVLLGDTTGACTASGDTAVFGKLIGGTSNKTLACTTSSFGGSGTSALTVTVGGCPTTGNPKAPATMSGSGVAYTPSGATLTSNTGGATQCTLSTCKPTFSY